jgi:hypothetical protein
MQLNIDGLSDACPFVLVVVCLHTSNASGPQHQISTVPFQLQQKGWVCCQPALLLLKLQPSSTPSPTHPAAYPPTTAAQLHPPTHPPAAAAVLSLHPSLAEAVACC